MGNIFDGLATLAIFGIVFIILLIFAAPFAFHWLWQHVSIIVK